MSKILRRGCWTVGGMTLTVVVIGMVLATPRVQAVDNYNYAYDSVSVNIPVACTMVGTVTKAHTASIVGGTRVPNIGTTEVNTVCNDKDGYIVYAMGTTQNDGTPVLSANIGSEYDIETGDAASGTKSSWGMQLAQITGEGEYPPDIVSDYTTYTSVPNTWKKVASKSAGISKTVNSQFTTTYAVYTTIDQPAGTYSGEVKYVMLHPSTTTVKPTTTLESAFAAAGKSKKKGVIDPVTGQTGDFYRMQDMDNAICSAVAPSDSMGYDEIQLVDDRDNKIYWVARLKDGNCWMTQNLDLDLSNGKALTSLDTDLTDNSLAGAYGQGYTYNPSSGLITWTPSATASSTGSWSNQNAYPYSKDRGKFYPEGTPASETINDYHRLNGNYYNWTAAIASNDSSTIVDDTYGGVGANPQNSICPKGWRLPTISSVSEYNEFSRLVSLYGNTPAKIMAEPLWFVRSGSVNYGTIYDSGSSGYYWSSTVDSSTNARTLYFNGSGIYPANSYYRLNGFSVRCLAR